MLKKFEVENYKNFKENIVIDFGEVGGYQFNTECLTNNTISKMLIYGRNATGKTNLGNAIMDIVFNLGDLGLQRLEEGTFLNADSKSDVAKFIYTFQFGKDEVIYKYTKNSNLKLRDEELVINSRQIFYVDFYKKLYKIPKKLIEIDAETINTTKYLNVMEQNGYTLPFLRWTISNTAFTEESILSKIEDYVSRMAMLTVGSSVVYSGKRIYEDFFRTLEEDSKLKEFEDFLNIMGVECQLVLSKLPDGQNELYFRHDRLVPFWENASSGTKTLMNLYRRIMMGTKASLMYIDEFDAFYHYEMSENVIRYFKEKYSKCQVILTSHNTNLISNRLMRPDCLFILSRSGKLTALCNATQRELREGHNLEKMYISGEFEKYE